MKPRKFYQYFHIKKWAWIFICLCIYFTINAIASMFITDGSTKDLDGHTKGFSDSKLSVEYTSSQNISEKHYSKDKQLKGYEKCRIQRLKRLKERCYNSGYRQFQPYSSINDKVLKELVKMMLVDTQHNILIMPTPKTGSGSWRDIIMKVTNKTSKYDLQYLNSVTPVTKIHEYLSNYFLLLTVRHPIARLESAYENKFVDNFFPEIMRLHGVFIIQRFRKQDLKDLPKLERQIISKEIDLKTISEAQLANLTRPTFEEFISYVIDRKNRRMDAHWDTYEESAHPCAFIYTHIARTETFQLDMDYVTRMTFSKSMMSHKNEGRLKDSSLALFEKLVRKDDLLSKVKERYGADMKLFGYTLHTDKTTGLLQTGCEDYGPGGFCC